MKNNEIVRKLKKLKFTEGVRTRHYTVWNCPDGYHPVHVGNQPSKESYFKGYKKQLGPHLDDFGKV